MDKLHAGMPTPRVKRLVCYECSVLLAKGDHEHYGYQCHACVVREHELLLTWRTDPDHPDVERLPDGPVDLGLVGKTG